MGSVKRDKFLGEEESLVNDCEGSMKQPACMAGWPFVTMGGVCMKLVENLVTRPN